MFDYDVVIAGYGPTGAVAANLLGAQGLRVLVVEPNTEIYEIPRAVHFDGEVLRIFQHLGLDEQMREVSEPAWDLNFVNARGWKLMEQDLRNIPRINHWPNSQFFSQPGLERHLRDGVARYDTLTEQLGSEVSNFTQSASGVSVEILNRNNDETTTVQCQYLLGCDGASSPTRRRLGIDQLDLQCDEPWLVCDWMLDEGTEFQRRTHQVCDPARPTTMVPCEGMHIRWEFMLNDDDDPETMEREENVRSLLAPHVHRLSPEIRAQDGKLVRAKVYHFHALIANSFQQDRVFLLGDAAHQMPPFLGQGMCAGIRDAYNLCWKLTGVLQGKFSERLLLTYTSERRPQVETIVKSAVAIGSVIQARNPVKAFMRDCVLMLGKVFPAIRNNMKIGDGWNLGGGLFNVDGEPTAGHAIGRPVPQIEMLSGDGDKILSDTLLGEGFALLVFRPDLVDEIAVVIKDSEIALTLVSLSNRDLSEAPLLAGWVEQNNAVAVLVRPDRQVFSLCDKSTDFVSQIRSSIQSLNQQCGLKA